MRVQNLTLVFPALPVRIPQDLSLVSDGSSGLGVPDPVLQFSSVSQQLGPSCKCPSGHREGMFPRPAAGGKVTTGKGDTRQAAVLLPPLADEGNAHQHRDKNRLAFGGNWEKKKRFKRLNILGKAPLPFAGQIWEQMQCPGKVQDVCTFHSS